MIRTDMHCHQCSNVFVARLDSSIRGNHVVQCPHCGHEHCRVIQDGEVTGDRWDSREIRVDVPKHSVWKADSRPLVTSSAGAFMRQLWLDRSDIQG